ncbi:MULTISPECIES: IS200/IS605 family element RNA-guided endonuclease TnpB [Bacillus cereus group]|uniref:Transposase, IS605 OrfB family n=1 Tax=Bacillus thuringiensis TaxID=1428 RepID=A0AB33B748_BACTU|nr:MULTISPECIES: IS200/IS605 family element RNA-guided endonuclease TnpB [Bacillus cereus group]MCU5430329.1 IS200/IS605 family element RNA-guided endonuclease TnpB [Bacillus cereus]PES75341.1 transposase [Bacillus anthracis]AJG79499.1 transposase, IS605 OrfB family [Bacillus thuringiensis]KXO02983.1 transposase [Bacillus thuringiensis]MEC3471098.1 IS200/IS605 family element RNA-guided endonuclease TnpB [Bacillus tropicus]
MLVNKAYKFRIYPNKEQEILIAKTIGCSRFVFNHFLGMWNDTYKETGKGLTYNACSAQLPQLKIELEWLKEVDSTAIQSALKNLADAYKRFFKKQNDKPRFKSKKNNVQSYTTKHTNGNIAIVDNKIKLPKLGFVKFAKSREIDGRIMNATVRRNSSGKYFVSILTEVEIQPLEKADSAIGIDLGITDFAILSDGHKIDNNKFTSKMEKKLKREQRKLSKRALIAKNKGIHLLDAKNYQKQKRKVARLHERVINQRDDFLNKLSTEIIKNHDIICIEDLNTKGMLRNHKLAKSISDVSWSAFVSKLEYKATWYGKTIVKVSRWFPSSQICSDCGHHDGKKSLEIRDWTCPICHANHDRDINASKNILAEGLRTLAFV